MLCHADLCHDSNLADGTFLSKLADWDDDDPSTLQETSSRWDKVVILKHLFTLAELEVCPSQPFNPFHRSPNAPY